MRKSVPVSCAGFTLVELLIGSTLAAIVMAGVLSSYVTLSRSFTRTLGISSANRPTLETQGRITLATFTEDVRVAGSVVGTPTNTSLSLALPSGTGTSTVAYSLISVDHDNNPATPDMFSLLRSLNGGTARTLHSNLLTCYFRYYDESGNPYDNSASPYTTITTYASGIKQLTLDFSSQAGSAANGTLTPVYPSASARLLIRNKALLP